MIDTDEYTEMWDQGLLDNEGTQVLMNTLLSEVARLKDKVEEHITAHYTLANGWSRAEQEWEQKERRLHNHIHAMYHWAKDNLREVHRDAWRQRYEKLYEEE